MSLNSPNSLAVRLTSTSSEETQEFGHLLGEVLIQGDLLLLHGGLGAGKTTLVQGIASGAGYTGPVTSPTFALIHQYLGSQALLYHVDLYRLETPSEVESLGIEDILSEEAGALIVEWPERCPGLQDWDHLEITLTTNETDMRTIDLIPFGALLEERIKSIDWRTK
jgi:tRNA threonylcarbamoyladenosine biosynthesis protein TsaE